MWTGCYGCLRWVQLLGAGLAAVAVNAVALIRELAQMDFLTIRAVLGTAREFAPHPVSPPHVEL